MPNKYNYTKSPVWTDLKKRYNIIMVYFNQMVDPNMYGVFDKADFTYMCKQLFENGKVYISEKAYELLLQNSDNISNVDLNMLTNGEARNEDGFNRRNINLKSANDTIVFEHTVPFDVTSRLFIENRTFENYKKILEFGVLTIITGTEDKKLNEAKLRTKMPDDWDGVNIFARYDKCGIKVIK